MKYTTEQVVNHLKNMGFVFQGSEIYGGLANTWDFGPLGVELERNIKNLWWKYFIHASPYNVGLNSAILMNPKVWKASGHLDNFSDPLIDCKNCKSRFRADNLIEQQFPQTNVGGWTNEQLETFIAENNIKCTKCGATNFTQIRQFELMFKTNQGVIQDESSAVYLRPETAQGIFVNFVNVQRTMRKKLPFGIGQIGKSFRNEITPGNFIFRTREFEQMELEFFFDPNDEVDWFEYWKNSVINFLDKINLRKENYILREHDKDELAHYSNRTIDIEYKFPFGQGELWGIAHRGDFDLSQHALNSNNDLRYTDPLNPQRKFYPHVIEPSVGVGRLMFALLYDAYHEEDVNDEKRIVLKLHHLISPYQFAILPLTKKQSVKAYDMYQKLITKFNCTFDDTANIGKRYRRQDAIGTPYCITYDSQSDEDNMVTIRNRDTMVQDRININDIENYLYKLLA